MADTTLPQTVPYIPPMTVLERSQRIAEKVDMAIEYLRAVERELRDLAADPKEKDFTDTLDAMTSNAELLLHGEDDRVGLYDFLYQAREFTNEVLEYRAEATKS